MCTQGDYAQMVINTDENTTTPMEFEKQSMRGKKHAIKIPSSLGLFIEDSSCFFVSGPEVQKKDKRQNSRLHWYKKTKQKKN